LLFLPHSTDLKLARRPYVTYAVILLCILIHYLQEQSRDAVWQAAGNYCELINSGNGGRSRHGLVDIVPQMEEAELDLLRDGVGDCTEALLLFHGQPNKGNIERFIREGADASEEELVQIIAQVEAHYRAFATNAPASLDERLMYDPATPNPIRMVTSSLAHGDWGHITFNLIFFFAFAPALELMCLHWLRYLGVLLAISVACSVSYSLFSIGSTPIPTLGLSGVVTGMIGLAAYMMPRARIRTFVWFFTFARNVYIPAWILALFYIGGDLITLLGSGNSGGVNVVAHVSGGISGYLIGRFWLREQKAELRDALEEEMEERRASREDLTGSGSTSRAGQQRMVSQRQEYQARRDYQAWLDRLHTLVNTEQYSEAVALLLSEYDHYAAQPEIYDELFEEFLKWRPGRATLCLGRLNITLLLKAGKMARALEVVKQCQAISPAFVLATPKQSGMLLKAAVARGEYELAHGLLHDAAVRYGEAVDAQRYRLMEAQLLIQHLRRYDEAKELLTAMLAEPSNPYRPQAKKMADYIEQMA
jgi:membrane associated rhomboid family serine protease